MHAASGHHALWPSQDHFPAGIVSDMRRSTLAKEAADGAVSNAPHATHDCHAGGGLGILARTANGCLCAARSVWWCHIRVRKIRGRASTQLLACRSSLTRVSTFKANNRSGANVAGASSIFDASHGPRATSAPRVASRTSKGSPTTCQAASATSSAQGAPVFVASKRHAHAPARPSRELCFSRASSDARNTGAISPVATCARRACSGAGGRSSNAVARCRRARARFG
jgi:hypothetical protein